MTGYHIFRRKWKKKLFLRKQAVKQNWGEKQRENLKWNKKKEDEEDSSLKHYSAEFSQSSLLVTKNETTDRVAKQKTDRDN